MRYLVSCHFELDPDMMTTSRAVYQHASIKYLQNDAMTNKSLRERFGLSDTYSASISRLIKEALKEQMIRQLDESITNRYIKYIPFWA